MDANQELCYEYIQKGHNLCILGQAGTGKTFTIKNVLNKLSTVKKISLTCYTGIAGLQYKDYRPMTLHSFVGMEDGRHSKENLAHLINSDERYIQTKTRIQATELLIIDEISMVSKRTFETVEYVCRSIKNSTKVFGGIQVVLSGDFFQLPPIKDELYGDNGDYCFNAMFFKTCFPHIVILNLVHRQNEPLLITAVNELENGCCSDHTKQFIQSLARPIICESDKKIVKLFARNMDADLCNYNNLLTINEVMHTYDAEDSGDVYYLNKFLAPKHFGVKVGAPVMLLTNMNAIHVNGLVGNVVALTAESIDVDFDGVLVKVERYAFCKYDPVTGAAIARRYQFPLRLAYAITIHKSQGMSLPLVEVDCRHAVIAGQIGVAIGRAISSSGLRVINFNPSLLRKHPPFIEQFYQSVCYPQKPDDSVDCCKSSDIVEHDQLSESDISDSDEELAELVCSLTTFNETQINLEHSYVTAKYSYEDMQQDFVAAMQDFEGNYL
jgi:ATP-dependent DNA helicase PIF1